MTASPSKDWQSCFLKTALEKTQRRFFAPIFQLKFFKTTSRLENFHLK
jgi:hypothetical protein